MLKELVTKNRSYRRFDENAPIERQTLVDLVDLARLTASAANRQPLKYYLSCDPETNGKIFPLLGWAGYLKDWPGPGEGERPAAYILILNDRDISKVVDCDHGIAAQTILLGAVERGLGGCILATVNKDRLAAIVGLPVNLSVRLVIALGKPVEKVVLEEVGASGSIQYWRDEDGVHHVPKRSLEDIILT